MPQEVLVWWIVETIIPLQISSSSCFMFQRTALSRLYKIWFCFLKSSCYSNTIVKHFDLLSRYNFQQFCSYLLLLLLVIVQVLVAIQLGLRRVGEEGKREREACMFLDMTHHNKNILITWDKQVYDMKCMTYFCNKKESTLTGVLIQLPLYTVWKVSQLKMLSAWTIFSPVELTPLSGSYLPHDYRMPCCLSLRHLIKV